MACTQRDDPQVYACTTVNAEPLGPWWFRVAARVRGATWAAAWLVLIASTFGRLLPIDPDAALDALSLGCLLLILTVVLDAALPTPRIPARAVGLPVRGRWRAINSPADRVPSHRTHAFGQTFAIDLVYWPEDGARPRGRARAFHPPQDFPGFGEEIVAPAAGRVVAVRDGARDHRSRSESVGFVGLVRSIGGARFLLGNHVVLDLGGGVYASLCHLKRRSATVKPGQQVAEGQVLARCGNSGNSTEPHLHFQLMDHPRELLAAGLPLAFTGLSDERSEPQGHLPRGGEIVASRDEPCARRPLACPVAT